VPLDGCCVALVWVPSVFILSKDGTTGEVTRVSLRLVVLAVLD